MLHFVQTYDSPRGLRIREYDAETYEDGKADAKAYCDHPCLEQISLSYHRKPAGDAADDGRGEPAEVAQEHLKPNVAAPHSDDVERGDVDNGHDSFLLAPWHSRNGVCKPLVEDDLLLVFGERDEMKVIEFPEHRLLVKGAREACLLESSGEVAELTRVPADLEKVHEQVGRNLVHKRILSDVDLPRV